MSEVNKIIIQLNSNQESYNMKVEFNENAVKELNVPHIPKHTLMFSEQYHRPDEWTLSDKFDLGAYLLKSNREIIGVTYNINFRSCKNSDGIVYSILQNQEFIDKEKKKKIQNKLDQIESLKKELEKIVNE